jgi:hypothetical protein
MTQLSCLLNIARQENNQEDIDKYSNEINKRRDKKKEYNKKAKANLLAKNVNDTHLTYHIGNVQETINGNLVSNTTENRNVSLTQAVKLLREYYGKRYGNTNQEQSDSSSTESKPVSNVQKYLVAKDNKTSPAVETTPKRGHKIVSPAPKPGVCVSTVYETAGINSVDYLIRNNRLQCLTFNFQFPNNSDEQQ